MKLRETQEVKSKILPSLFLAYHRITGVNKTSEQDLNNYMDMVVGDIHESFPNATVDQIKNAIKQGTLGKYGRVNRFTGTDVYIWIDRYLAENPRIPGPEEAKYLDFLKRVTDLTDMGRSVQFDGPDNSAVNDAIAIFIGEKSKDGWRSWDELFDESNDDVVGILDTNPDEPVRRGDYIALYRETARNMRKEFLELHKKYGEN